MANTAISFPASPTNNQQYTYAGTTYVYTTTLGWSLYLGSTSLPAYVLEANIATSAVTTAKIADSNVTTVKILDSNITTDKIANDAVTTAKILDSNVTTAKIANDAVTTVKILDSNVTTAKIANDAVTTIKISNGSVTTDKLDPTIFLGTGGVFSNTALGSTALHNNTTGVQNVAIGYLALLNTTSFTNTAIGAYAGADLTTGSNVTCLGYNAQPTANNVSNQIVLGDGAISTFRCQVALTVVSDERDKTNIVNIPVGLDLVSKIKPVSFEWNQRDGNRIGRKEFGFTAQQLQSVQAEIGIEVPYLVDNENPENLGVSSSQLIPVLVKAIQELNAKFEVYVATHP